MLEWKSFSSPSNVAVMADGTSSDVVVDGWLLIADLYSADVDL